MNTDLWEAPPWLRSSSGVFLRWCRCSGVPLSRWTRSVKQEIMLYEVNTDDGTRGQTVWCVMCVRSVFVRRIVSKCEVMGCGLCCAVLCVIRKVLCCTISSFFVDSGEAKRDWWQDSQKLITLCIHFLITVNFLYNAFLSLFICFILIDGMNKRINTHLIKSYRYLKQS